MWRRSHKARLGAGAAALLALLAALTACAPLGPAQSARTQQPSGPPAIITRSASANSPEDSDHHLSVSVSCHPGEQMLAGGYALDDVFESDYMLLASYPATDNTWRVETDSGSHYQLQVLAYCLTNSPSLGIRALQASACPAGMTRLSQGVNHATPYALCAAHGATLTAHGIQVGALEFDCASQATGTDQSETRSFSYICVAIHAAP